MTEKQNLIAHRGLTLPKKALRRLKETGIFAQAHVSLEHQHLKRRYVVRGVESGGAVKEIGRYITFCGPNGEPVPYLHPLDAIAVNGVHAVVVAEALIRIDLFRTGRTCQLLITEHKPGPAENGRRPRLENEVLFRGVNGFIEAGQIGPADKPACPTVPRFWSRAGEEREIPALFAAAIRAATLGSSCCGCSHTHFSVAPTPAAVDELGPSLAGVSGGRCGDNNSK
jgi:hypothetical protein